MHDQPTNPETVDLVLRLLRARHDPSVELRETPTVPRFMAALKFAGRHGVASALVGGLGNVQTADAGWTALQPFLDEIERRTAARNLRLRSSALALSRLLTIHGVDVVFLKGATFLLNGSGSAPWRELSDLDVLIAPEKVEIAAEVMRAQGYTHALDPSAYHEQYHHHYAPLYHRDEDVMVELHTRLMQNPRDDLVRPEEIFGQARLASPMNEPVSIPSPEHRVIHLIAHAQLSNWGYALRRVWLKDILDFWHLATTHPIDWSLIDAAFSRIGARHQLNAFLRLCEELWGRHPDLPHITDRNAETWARAARLALAHPPAARTLSLRMAYQYIVSFARNPGRLGIVWQVLRDPVRRQEFARLNRDRLRRPE